VNVTAVFDIHYLSFFTPRLSGTARDLLEGFEGLSGSTLLAAHCAGAGWGCGGKSRKLSTAYGSDGVAGTPKSCTRCARRHSFAGNAPVEKLSACAMRIVATSCKHSNKSIHWCVGRWDPARGCL